VPIYIKDRFADTHYPVSTKKACNRERDSVDLPPDAPILPAFFLRYVKTIIEMTLIDPGMKYSIPLILSGSFLFLLAGKARYPLLGYHTIIS